MSDLRSIAIGLDSERTKKIKKSVAIFDLLWLAFLLLLLIINIILIANGMEESHRVDYIGKYQAASALTMIASGIILPVGIVIYFVKRVPYSRQIKQAMQADYEDFVREITTKRDKHKEEIERKK